MSMTMLIVEDDEGLRAPLERSLRRRGYEVRGTPSTTEAVRLLGQRGFDLVLLDMRLPDGSGLDVLAAARGLDEEIDVIMMTAFPEVKTAVRAMREGARDFIVKPFELDELHLVVERTTEARALRRRVQHLERERGSRDEITDILGESPAIRQVRDQIQKVAGADTPVLILGETGTGKELVADAVHRLSPRREAPLVKVNCSAFSEMLLESELFGHDKGAFTDAREARAGLFEMADGGTLFLDEISEMKPGLQAKLLRVVEGQPFRRVGGGREIQTDVRVIAATHRDLPARIRTGLFREDLYFRLCAFPIEVPPLRARADDVVLLARFYLRHSTATLRKGTVELAATAEAALLDYPWPGNVRELRNVMERAAILCETGTVEPEHLPGGLRVSAFVQRQIPSGNAAMPSLKDLERRYIAHVATSMGGNLSEAARILGIGRNTLKARLRTPEDAQPEP